MKKILISLGILATSVSVAQADVGLSKEGVTDGFGYKTDLVNLTLYGIWDVGVGRLDHSYGGSDYFASTVNPYNLNNSQKSFNGLFSSGVSMSRFGVQGDKVIADDFKVFFKLESAFNSISGNLSSNGKALYNDMLGNNNAQANGASAINGQWFSRAAYVGLSHPLFGSVEYGRTTNFSLDQVAEYDPVQAALLFSPLGFSGGIGGGLGTTENTRLDNSIKYENTVHDVSFGIQYKAPGSKGDQEVESAAVGMLGYRYGPLSMKGTYGYTWNSVAYGSEFSNSQVPDTGLKIVNTQGYMLSGKYEVTPDATLKAGYESSIVSMPSNLNLTYITRYYGMSMPSTAANGVGADQHFETIWFGGDYKLTKELDIGAGYYNIDTFNAPEINKQYHSNAYSLLVDYTFYKGLDVYAAAMLMDYSGAALSHDNPNEYSHNAIYGTGLRVKF